jgi:hypothetical protein
MPFVVYHVVGGPVTFPFATDAKHAVSRFPSEWSRTPWPVAPAPVDDNPTNLAPDRITAAIADLTDRVVEFRKVTAMDRLTEKLAMAGGVVGRITADLEQRADLVIAREEKITDRSKQIFSAKNGILDDAERGLDGIEAKMALLNNDPLPVSASSLPTPSPLTEKI